MGECCRPQRSRSMPSWMRPPPRSLPNGSLMPCQVASGNVENLPPDAGRGLPPVLDPPPPLEPPLTGAGFTGGGGGGGFFVAPGRSRYEPCSSCLGLEI